MSAVSHSWVLWLDWTLNVQMWFYILHIRLLPRQGRLYIAFGLAVQSPVQPNWMMLMPCARTRERMSHNPPSLLRDYNTTPYIGSGFFFKSLIEFLGYLVIPSCLVFDCNDGIWVSFYVVSIPRDTSNLFCIADLWLMIELSVVRCMLRPPLTKGLIARKFNWEAVEFPKMTWAIWKAAQADYGVGMEWNKNQTSLLF